MTHEGGEVLQLVFLVTPQCCHDREEPWPVAVVGHVILIVSLLWSQEILDLIQAIFEAKNYIKLNKLYLKLNIYKQLLTHKVYLYI